MRWLWAVAIVAMAPARAADACSPPQRVSLIGVSPSRDATGIPTNARIVAAFRGVPGVVPGDGDAMMDVIVRPVGGSAIATTRSHLANRYYPYLGRVLVQPDAPLAPATQYEVLSRIEKEPCTATGCLLATHAVVATFTTGAGPDLTPPTFAGLKSVTTNYKSCGGSSCCGPYEAGLVSFDWDVATDQGSGVWVSYNLYQLGVPDPVMPLSYERIGQFFCGGSSGDAGGYFSVLPGTYRVRAVDLSGNEDTNDVTFDVTTCELPAVPDAGAQTNDAGAVVDAAGVGGGGDAAGCACQAAGRVEGSPVWLLVLAGLTGLWRRRGCSL